MAIPVGPPKGPMGNVVSPAHTFTRATKAIWENMESIYKNEQLSNQLMLLTCMEGLLRLKITEALLTPIKTKYSPECLCFTMTHQCVSQSHTPDVNLAGGCGYALLVRYYGCRVLSWRK